MVTDGFDVSKEALITAHTCLREPTCGHSLDAHLRVHLAPRSSPQWLPFQKHPLTHLYSQGCYTLHRQLMPKRVSQH